MVIYTDDSEYANIIRAIKKLGLEEWIIKKIPTKRLKLTSQPLCGR